MFLITLHNQLKVSAKWQLHGSWHELLDSIFFLLLQIGHHLLTGHAHRVNVEIPCDGTLFHLFRLAKYAYDANPSILKCKIKGGSEYICKTVYVSVFGSIFVKEVEELHAFQIYYEMKQNCRQLWVTSRNPTHCNTELYEWWKAGHDEGCLLADLPQNSAVERPNYYQTLTVGTLSKKDILIYLGGYVIVVTEK